MGFVRMSFKVKGSCAIDFSIDKQAKAFVYVNLCTDFRMKLPRLAKRDFQLHHSVYYATTSRNRLA
jgi:hypothetical protein